MDFYQQPLSLLNLRHKTTITRCKVTKIELEMQNVCCEGETSNLKSDTEASQS
jgi:hypothetical protein